MTGDAHLLQLGEYQDIMILTPRAFLTVLHLVEHGPQDPDPSSASGYHSAQD